MRTPGFTALVHAALAMLLISSAPASAKQWDMVAGSYHTHLIFHGDRFELHSGDWVLLFRVEAPGRTPVQVRYSSKMKPGTQPAETKPAETKPAAKEKAKGHDGHAHHDGH
jgi:hypothetical protein